MSTPLVENLVENEPRDSDAGRPTRGTRVWSWFRRSWVPLVLILASLAMVGTVTASNSKAFGPFDEWVYYDYVTKIPTQFVVREGETIGKPALKAESCFGDAGGRQGAPCGGPYDNPSIYPMQGKTSADLYTPVYFAVTWGIARAIQTVTSLDLLTASRLSGFVWLAAGMWVFSRIMSRFRVRNIVTVGLGLAYIGSPIAAWTYTFISTDAPSFLVGGALLLAAVRFVRGEGSGWWLVPIGVIGVCLKITSLAAVGMILAFFVVYAITRWRTPERLVTGVTRARLLIVGIVMTASSLAAEVVWIVIRAALKVGDQPSQGLAEPLGIHTIAANATAFLPGPFAFNNGPLGLPAFVSIPFAWLVTTGVVAAVFVIQRWGVNRSLSIAIALAVTVFAPLMFIGTAILTGEALPISPRYGASLIAPMFLALAYILRNRMSHWIVLSYGSALFALTMEFAVKVIVLRHS